MHDHPENETPVAAHDHPHSAVPDPEEAGVYPEETDAYPEPGPYEDEGPELYDEDDEDDEDHEQGEGEDGLVDTNEDTLAPGAGAGAGAGPAGPDGAVVDAAADAAPDVFLDVPLLKVDEIDLDVEDLRARVSLQAEVLDLLKLNVGADVVLGRVHLGISGVEAQAQLTVRLDNVATIINRVLTTLDRNPEMLQELARGVGSAVQDVGGGARRPRPGRRAPPRGPAPAATPGCGRAG